MSFKQDYLEQPNMVKHVYLDSDVFMVCLNHALSTEKEEVMGLLIGEVDEISRVSKISAVIVLRRSDKRPDRVEISPEQLSDASTQAEKMSVQQGRPLRVLGWYHSHPHITVWPSHVDVRTQFLYQMMDELFIGLIFSVFNEDKNTLHNRVQLVCFQASDQSGVGDPSQCQRVEIPVSVTPTATISRTCLKSIIDLPSVLRQEEEDAYGKAAHCFDLDALSQLHNGAVFTKSLCHITEVVCVPLLQMLTYRLDTRREQLRDLKKEKEQLSKRLKTLKQKRRS